MGDSSNGKMTKADRQELSKLVRRHELVAKSAVKQRGAELLAHFEKQLATIHKYYQDEVWKEAHDAAKAAAREADEKIAARCREVGIPEDWRPGLSLNWYGRGETAAAGRRQELRRVAITAIDAMEKKAVTQIEEQSLRLQTLLVADGLDSEAARAFLAALPSPQELMPPLDVAEIELQLPLPSGRRQDDD
jgi:hypothetical protein